MLLNEILTWEPAPENIDRALDEELRFIADWEGGKVPFLAAIVRVRQVYRAFPAVAMMRA